MILRIKIEISQNDLYNSLGFNFHNETPLPKRSVNRNNIWRRRHRRENLFLVIQENISKL